MSEYSDLISVLNSYPVAFAVVNGSEKYPEVYAKVNFYRYKESVIIATFAQGLPISQCGSGVLGFHIHSGGTCTGNEEDSFKDALTHYNPKGCTHPYHAGDMPPLFSENGNAFSVFMTERFEIEDIIGKTIIIHSMPDDFISQPAGNSDEKIACGIIRKKRAASPVSRPK